MQEKPSSAVQHSSTSRVEEVGGKKMLRFTIPAAFQGHTFAIDLQKSGKEQKRVGPFRIEFVLCNEFQVYSNDLGGIDPELGFSNLTVGPPMNKLNCISVVYGRSDKPQETYTAEIRLNVEGGFVRRFIMTLPEPDLDTAIKHGSQIISSILDSICFRKQVPLQIHHIEIFQAETGDPLRRYMTFPYTIPVDVDERDIASAPRIPPGLGPCLRLFREGISSTRPHYRLLCLYRVWEGIKKLTRVNKKTLLARGITPRRPNQKVPDNELTREYFPNLVGKKIGAFLDHVRSNFRIPVAHLKLDDYERMLLDPASVRVDHRIDYTNAVLIHVVRRVIEDEWKLMEQHNLGQPVLPRRNRTRK